MGAKKQSKMWRKQTEKRRTGKEWSREEEAVLDLDATD
jgi:hypothetical protein